MAIGVYNGADRQIQIAIGPTMLAGTLSIPHEAHGVVLFAHDSGSSRFSPRNRAVARILRESGLATLLMDLLTPEEERVDMPNRQLRSDIDLLAHRLIYVTDWLAHNADTRRLSIGYFGASTGGGAALMAAAMRTESVSAVVSRGGRPDLAGNALQQVKSPVLLIVGSRDTVLAMNQQALDKITAEKKLEIVPGASHLFDEPGTLEHVATTARDWFNRYLRATPAVTPPKVER